MAQQQSLPYPIWSKPGIKRDGTKFEGDFHVDGKWVRWDRDRPRKIGGCISKSAYLTNIARGLDLYPSGGINYIHIGETANLEAMQITTLGVPSLPYDRTPAGLATNANYLWQFDQLFDAVSGKTVLLAHPGVNLTNIDNATTSLVYYGDATATTVLTAITSSDVSGGVCAIGPFMVYYGSMNSSNGGLNWSDVNKPTTLSGGQSGTANPTAQKVVKGMQVRGGVGNGPSGIFFSLDSVILMSFVGGTPVFNFDTIDTDSSILSSSCAVNYDGIIYWVTTNRFKMFNGVVQENPNPISQNWFFDNLNFAQRQKVFAFKNERWGEIWWCYPRGTATECTDAIIYNVRLSQRFGFPVWYDTVLPANRSSGFYGELWPYPIMGGTTKDSNSGKFKLWQHEIGVDYVDTSPAGATAIQSFYETADISPTVTQGLGPAPRGLYCETVAPDFVQTGSMNFNITGRNTARGADIVGPTLSFPDTVSAADPTTQLLYPKETRNQMRFRFESNTLGGNYQDGQPLAYLRPSDGRNIT